VTLARHAEAVVNFRAIRVQIGANRVGGAIFAPMQVCEGPVGAVIAGFVASSVVAA